MRGMHARSGSPRRRFSINGVFRMNVESRITNALKVNVTLLLALNAGVAFLSGKHLMPINDSERGTLLHIGAPFKKNGAN